MSNNYGSNYGQPNLGFSNQQTPFVPPGSGQNSPLYPQLNQPYPASTPGYGSYTNPPTGQNLPYPINPLASASNAPGFNQPYPGSGTGYQPPGYNAQYPAPHGGNMPNPAPYLPAYAGSVQNPSGMNAPYPTASSGSMDNPPVYNSPYPHGPTANVTNPSVGGGQSCNPGYGSAFSTNTPYNQGNELNRHSSTSSPYTTFSTNPSVYPQPNEESPYRGRSPQTVSMQSYESHRTTSGYQSGSTICDVKPDRPTIRASTSFDAVSDAGILRKAMKGIGTDEKAIVNVLGRRTSNQRQQIILSYQQSFGRELLNDLKKELTGNFEQVIVALMTPLPTYLASELYKAMKGIGTKEGVLIEVLCTQDNNMIRTIKMDYEKMYKRTLQRDIQDDTSGDFKRLLISVCTGARQEGAGNPEMAQKLAQELYKAGEGRWGTNDSDFNRIMAAYSRNQLQMVFSEYKKIKGRSVEDAIKSELSGEFKTSMLALYDSMQNRPNYFAKKIHEAMAGMGTKDDALIRLIVARSEIDLGSIKEHYQTLYRKTLDSAVSSETSGDYKRILLVLLQD